MGSKPRPMTERRKRKIRARWADERIDSWRDRLGGIAARKFTADALTGKYDDAIFHGRPLVLFAYSHWLYG